MSELKSIADFMETVRQFHEKADLNTDIIDVDDLSPDELKTMATLSRLERLADRDADEIINDHKLNIGNTHSADRMADMCSVDYMLKLNLSYAAITRMATEMIVMVEKYGVKPPQHWLDMREGQFDFAAELTRAV